MAGAGARFGAAGELALAAPPRPPPPKPETRRRFHRPRPRSVARVFAAAYVLARRIVLPDGRCATLLPGGPAPGASRSFLGPISSSPTPDFGPDPVRFEAGSNVSVLGFGGPVTGIRGLVPRQGPARPPRQILRVGATKRPPLRIDGARGRTEGRIGEPTDNPRVPVSYQSLETPWGGGERT